MRILGFLLALIGTTAANAVSQQKKEPAPVPAKVTVLGEVRDSVCDEVAISPNEKLLACATLRPDMRIIDVSTNRTTVLFKGMFAEDLFWSRTGNQLAFTAREKGSNEFYIWTVSLDPRNGQQTAEPRRASATPGFTPAFSPDAQWIAFVTGNPGARKVVVTPAAGGGERVLAEGRLFGPIAWSSDAKWIYYPGRATATDSSDVVYRVSATGGKPERVPTMSTLQGRAINATHSLSRDGRYLSVATRPMNGAQVKAILDPLGKTLGIASMPGDVENGTSSDYDWMPAGPRMLQTRVSRPQTLRSVNLATGGTRDLGAATDRARGPSWSPDGRRIAVQVWTGARYDIAIIDADGTNRRLLHTDEEPTVPTQEYWSPDGRYLAYTTARTLHVVEVATGRDTKLGNAEILISNFYWTEDSRSVIFVCGDGGPRTRGPDNGVRVSLKSATVDGQLRTLRDLGIRDMAILFLNDKSVLAVTEGMVYPVNGGAPRRVHSPTTVRPKPAVSPDGRWIAFTPNGLGGPGNAGVYDVVSVDGTARFTVRLPAGLNSAAALLSHDNRNLIVPTVRGDADESGAPNASRIMIVPVNGDPPHLLTQLPSGEGVGRMGIRADQYFDARLSPDGKTLLYIGVGPSVQTFLAVDLSPAIGPVPASTAAKP